MQDGTFARRGWHREKREFRENPNECFQILTATASIMHWRAQHGYSEIRSVEVEQRAISAQFGPRIGGHRIGPRVSSNAFGVTIDMRRAELNEVTHTYRFRSVRKVERAVYIDLLEHLLIVACLEPCEVDHCICCP